MFHKISSDLTHLAKPVEFLYESPNNANVHPRATLQQLADSFKEFGQLKPIVAREDGEVIAGNGSFIAMRDILGWSHVAANIVELDDESALAYAIADNRTADLSQWDYRKVKDTLDLFKAPHAGMDEAFMSEITKHLNKKNGSETAPEVDLSEFEFKQEKEEVINTKLRYSIECRENFLAVKTQIDATLTELGIPFEVKIE